MMTDDKEIIQSMKTDPRAGFRQLMKRYEQSVYWHIRRLVVSHADAQDASQETFVRIYRSFDRFNADCSLTSWVFRIATNEALRLLDRRKKEMQSIDNTSAALFELRADQYTDYSDVEAVRLQKAILSLPTKQQIAFNLRYYDELSYDEIAHATQSTAASAKVNYHIAKEKIIKYMNEND